MFRKSFVLHFNIQMATTAKPQSWKVMVRIGCILSKTPTTSSSVGDHLVAGFGICGVRNCCVWVDLKQSQVFTPQVECFSTWNVFYLDSTKPQDAANSTIFYRIGRSYFPLHKIFPFCCSKLLLLLLDIVVVVEHFCWDLLLTYLCISIKYKRGWCDAALTEFLSLDQIEYSQAFWRW